MYQINYIAALVQIMAWRRPGDGPSSEQMISLPPQMSLGFNELTHSNDITTFDIHRKYLWFQVILGRICFFNNY